MKITGYRTLTEKERDYLTIHRLLRKHKIPTSSFDDLLDILKGEVASSLYSSNLLLEFCVTNINSEKHMLYLDKLPANTEKLVIET